MHFNFYVFSNITSGLIEVSGCAQTLTDHLKASTLTAFLKLDSSCYTLAALAAVVHSRKESLIFSPHFIPLQIRILYYNGAVHTHIHKCTHIPTLFFFFLCLSWTEMYPRPCEELRDVSKMQLCHWTMSGWHQISSTPHIWRYRRKSSLELKPMKEEGNLTK